MANRDCPLRRQLQTFLDAHVRVTGKEPTAEQINEFLAKQETLNTRVSSLFPAQGRDESTARFLGPSLQQAES